MGIPAPRDGGAASRGAGQGEDRGHSSTLPRSAPEGGPPPPTHNLPGPRSRPLSPKTRSQARGRPPPPAVRGAPEPPSSALCPPPPCLWPRTAAPPTPPGGYPATGAASGSGLSSASSSPGGNRDPDFRFRAPAATGSLRSFSRQSRKSSIPLPEASIPSLGN